MVPERQAAPTQRPLFLERAQMCIADSADRGSTPEERAAAMAWLTTGAARVVDVDHTSIGAAGETAAPGGMERGRHGSMSAVPRSAPPLEVAMVPERQAAPTQRPLTRDQVDACCRLQRRIRVRTDVIRRLLEPERDEMMELVLDLLVEIRAANEALEKLLQDAGPG
jgi:hypothetical protein